MMRGRFTFAAVFVLALLWAAPAQAETTYVTSFGSASTSPANPYPLSNPSGVAVNDTSGDIYVADTANNRIEQFDSGGNFIRMWGKGVDVTTGGDICPEAPGDACVVSPGPEAIGEGAGSFRRPVGIAVDNSNGPAAGSVYVVDLDNNRIQRFTADGEFVLTWGKAVNAQTGGSICTAAQTCQAGLKSTAEPTEDGVFSGWITQGSRIGLQIATGPDGDVYVADERFSEGFSHERIQRFDSDGNLVGGIYAPTNGFKILSPLSSSTPVVAANGDVYIANDTAATQCFGCFAYLVRYDDAGFAPGAPGAAEFNRSYGANRHVMRVTVDPTNGFLIGLGRDCNTINSFTNAVLEPVDTHITEYQPNTSQEVDCTVPALVPGSPTPDLGGGLAMTTNPSHRLYITHREDDLTHEEDNLVQIWQPPSTEPPVVTDQKAVEITATGARINTQIIGNLAETTFHVEYGTAGPCSSNPCTSAPEAGSIGSALTPRAGSDQVNGLQPDTTYYYRVVATNGAGSTPGPDRSFRTFAEPLFDPSCANNLARQQTGAAFLLDCRAYELVSAENQGGYDVASDLVSGQQPYGGYPSADDSALYAIHNGGIPGVGKPTNRGPDPYVAVRDAANKRWRTDYVGIPADVGSAAPFSSTVAGADSVLGTFAFAGAQICDPCFGDGSAGMPLRQGVDGALEQGMVGSEPVADPEPAGTVRKPLSADGSHLLFGSEQQFEPAGNPDNGNVTIYDRDLKAGTTQVVSTLPDGSTIENSDDVLALDISTDGSRVLIGNRVATDSEGNEYFHLYMHVGSSPNSIDLTPGTSSGVLYAGMDKAGTKVYFTTRDALTGNDSDTSADLYRAKVDGSSASLARVSTGAGTGDTDACDPAGNSFNINDWNVIPGGPTDCSVVALGGGSGVATESGAVYFLSPETLDGEGVTGAPNLFLAEPGASPKFVATLESGASSPLPAATHGFERSFGSFDDVTGVAIDGPSGAIYALDLNGAEGFGGPVPYVRKFDASGNPDNTFAGDSILDGADGSGSEFTGLAEGGVFGFATGIAASIAVDDAPASPNYGDLYVPDAISGTLRRFSSSGVHEATISVAPFPKLPSSVAVNPTNGKVYVGIYALFGEKRVFVFEPNGTPASPASFAVGGSGAAGIAVDSGGTVYVAQGSSTVEYDGSTGAEIGVLDPNASYGVAYDPTDDHVYVDRGNQVVEYASGSLTGSPIGSGVLSNSVDLSAYGGRVAASNPGSDNIAVWGPSTTAPDRAYDNPLVLNSLRDSESRHTTDFQTTPNGDPALFTSTLPLTGFDSEGKYNVYRYDAAGDQLDCVSCNSTLAIPTSDASLASNGLSVSDDGRVFFNSGEPLVLRDSNHRKDVYEWREQDGGVELISTGLGQFDSSLLTVTTDGTDAFFFTRDTLAKNDSNGTLVKLYTAREDGGFFVIPPQPQCRASDECHGPGSPAPPPPSINTVNGTDGNAPTITQKRKSCKRGFVKRRRRCVRRHAAKRRANSRTRSTR